MYSLNSFQFPATPKSFIGDLVTVDAIQQHWLQTCTQLQQDWFGATRGIFSDCQSLAIDGQNFQSLVFGQYLDWIKNWSDGSVSPVVESQETVASVSPKVNLKLVEGTGTKIETPALIGWIVDDLTRIRGVGKVLQQRLYEEGIVNYLQITEWEDSEIARIEDEVLGSRFSGRISRDQWQAQAEELMKG